MAAIKAVPDAMSDVLSLMHLRIDFVCANEYAGPFSLSFRARRGHFHVVEQGAAFLTLEGRPPVRVDSGDVVILPPGAGHVLSSDPAMPAVPIERAIKGLAVRSGHVFHFGSDAQAHTRTVCGQFAFEGVLAPRVLGILPRLIHVTLSDGHSLEWLRLTSSFLAEEARSARPGSNAVVARLLEVLFVQALRQWGSRSPSSRGELSGLTDPQVGRVLSAIREEPARAWTVQSLAGRAGLSRSAFAARFRAVVDQPPRHYLTLWRLSLAADYLRAGSARVRDIAVKVGYGSEAALSRAFKTRFGTTPAAFRRRAFWRAEPP